MKRDGSENVFVWCKHCGGKFSRLGLERHECPAVARAKEKENEARKTADQSTEHAPGTAAG